MRYIGVDLHTTQITVCYLKAEAEFEIRKYQLVEMDKFINTLEISDELAIEAIIKIVEKLDQVTTTGVLDIDLSWLNNNLQRWMWRYVRKATASRLRELKKKKRYGLLVCFLQQQH